MADDFGRGQGGRPTAVVEKADDTQKPRANLYYAATSANIRNIAASEGSEIIGKLARGDEVQGKLITAEDGSEWLELSDGKGFVFAANLTTTEMPLLATKPTSPRTPQLMVMAAIPLDRLNWAKFSRKLFPAT